MTVLALISILEAYVSCCWQWGGRIHGVGAWLLERSIWDLASTFYMLQCPFSRSVGMTSIVLVLVFTHIQIYGHMFTSEKWWKVWLPFILREREIEQINIIIVIKWLDFLLSEFTFLDQQSASPAPSKKTISIALNSHHKYKVKDEILVENGESF